MEKLDRFGRRFEIDETIVTAKDIIRGITSPDSLERLTIELYRKQVYANTPEVIAFAREPQELRKELLEVK